MRFLNKMKRLLCKINPSKLKDNLQNNPIYQVRGGLFDILSCQRSPESVKSIIEDIANEGVYALPVNWNRQHMGIYYILVQEPIQTGKALYLINYIREIALLVSQRLFQMETINNSQYYRILVQQSSDLQFIVQNARLLFYNQIVPRFTGYSHSELRSRPIFSFLHPDEMKKIHVLAKNSLKSKEPLRFVTRIIIKSGESRFIDLTLTNLKKELDKLFMITARDISAHIQTQQVLIRSENLHRMAINSLRSAVAVSDASHCMLLYNQSFIDLLKHLDISCTELKGNSIEKLLQPHIKDISVLFSKAVSKNEPLSRSISQTLRGEPCHLQINITPLYENETLSHCVTVIQDLTDQTELLVREKMIKSRMLEQERMSSVSLLAGGVAHEVNNPITGIINYAALIELRTQDALLKKFAKGIQKEGERVTDIVRNLLSFARQDKSETEAHTVEEIVHRSLMLIESHLRRDGISIEIKIEENLPKIVCNIEKMKQVMLNLLFNAREALNFRADEGDFDKIISIQGGKSISSSSYQ
ncbi:MAG TPA: PAS domain S-box protein [Candidatus Marinimicrobia bacterium]|nr:PAS domain S-box protein [Candidatus Neomarinimicrobiota bacterium]